MILLVLLLFTSCCWADSSFSNDFFQSHAFDEKHFFTAPIRTPQIIMTDITNSFAFNILYLHSISNVNNIAFSPCGLGSVLIALFEGSEGLSSFQIYRALHLPWEKDIIRVGYRDIHRKLKVNFLCVYCKM